MPLAPQVAAVACPNCGTRFNVEVYSIIDVGQTPQHKQQFLSGQLNQGTCPQCGSGGMLAVPFLYHDPGKELALFFLPPSLNLPDSEQQRLIGRLTNEAMTSLTAEQRRGYLLQPEVFLGMERLMTRILEADGITAEMLAAQQARIELIEEFLEAEDDEDRLRALVDEHRDSLDYSFFQTLTANLEAVEAEGETELTEKLLRLRNKLLDFSDLGRSSRAQRRLYESLEDGLSREELLDQLLAAEGEPELQGMVSVARPLLDYQFYLMLSSRIDSADEAEAQRLAALRQQLLALAEELDKEAEAALARSSTVLQAMLESEDQEAAVRAHLPDIDDMLLGLLSTSIRQAEAQNQTDRASALRRIWEIIIRTLEEAMPPEIQLINRLLNAQAEENRQALMEEHDELMTSELLELMERMAADLAERGQPQAGDRLRSILAEVADFIQTRGSEL